MKLKFRLLAEKSHRGFSRIGPTFFLFPLHQALLHEARTAATTGLVQVAKWSVATVAGLGAYDTVSGATVITQLAPAPSSSAVPATTGEMLNFIYQVTGAPSTAKSWQVIGTLPNGLVHQNATRSNVDSINGIPTESGDFPITIKAWEEAGNRGGSKSKSFTIRIAAGSIPPEITTQPSSLEIEAGTAATLQVVASGESLTFQWYEGAPGDISVPLSGATSAIYTTPILQATTGYWVKVTNSAGGRNSNPAVVTVIDNFASWQRHRFDQSQLADSSISGPGSDPDRDGVNNEKEFIFGTSPLTPDLPPPPALLNESGQLTVSFTAKEALGPGYSGLTRHYTLESSSSLEATGWVAIPGFSDLIGNGQVVNYLAPFTSASNYYHLRVWLSP